MIPPFLASLFLVGLGSAATPAPLSRSEPDWVAAERGVLENHVQLTSHERFRKAGECYFSPDGRQIVFQAIERLADESLEERYYQMYVADLVLDGAGRVSGTDNLRRLSPSGSSNTCGWFHPTEPGTVIFGSTLVPPSNADRAGYQRESSRYAWQFPREMDIVRCELARADGTARTLERLIGNSDAYLAECVISADGRYLVYCEHRVEEGTSGGDLLVRELATGRTIDIAVGAGYDGGPFFTPDGRRLCYRSDRRGNDLLQVYVAELEFDDEDRLVGVAREFQLTDNTHVNWAPYWHPSGRHIAYATSEIGHDNYEVFLIDADAGDERSPTKYGTRRRRVTRAEGFDGLPVFDAQGARMMWTSQRGPERSSQVWIADFVMPLDWDQESGADPVVAEAAPEAKNARPERLQVQDPQTGLYFLYDLATHELSVYDPTTHKVRPAGEGEVARAMELFRAEEAREEG